MNCRQFFLNLSFLVSAFHSTGQTDLRGLWNGTISTDNHDSHAKYMINIEEHTNGIVSGKALVYKPNIYSHAFGLQQFYGKIEKNSITINDIQILDEKRPSSSFHLCFKLSKLNYNTTGERETLSGSWSSKTTNCLPGKIQLFRFDEKKETDQIPPYVLKAIKRNGAGPNFRKTSLSSPVALEVSSSVIRMELKDYLKEDNDTVSIYLNRQPLFSNLNIKKKPYKFVVWLNRELVVNELIMYANNLGLIPPNTSYLLISDGEKTHKLLIQSSLEKSAAIYLKYKPR